MVGRKYLVYAKTDFKGSTFMKFCRIYSAIIISATLLAPLAYAQVEEITITAQRREASLQEVPISVSSFSTDDMEKLQINAVGDVAAAVPNMQTYDVTANASAMQVFMRGAGIQNPGFNASESPVGIYVDDVYRGRLATANIDLTDIERVEVLRGPKGTLYGRNTVAGVVIRKEQLDRFVFRFV
jgi:iron complex outermembrane receptor protein